MIATRPTTRASRRPRRALAAGLLAAALVALGAGRAAADGALASFSFTASSTTAGGSAAVTAAVELDYGADPSDNIERLTITLPPGMAAALVNVPATCSEDQLTRGECPEGSVIGGGQARLAAPAPATLYLMPPRTSDDLAGIGVAIDDFPTFSATGALDVATAPDGRPVGVVDLRIARFGLQIRGLVATIHAATADGKPFTRLPTSCAASAATATISTHEGLTGTASAPFAATGCGLLAFAPTLHAVGVGEAPGDSGVDLTVALRQPGAATEAATRTLVLDLPPAIVPIASAVASCLTGTPCVIGSVTAASPLVTSAQLRRGAVILGGTSAAPTVTLRFPEPAAFEIAGTVDIPTGAVTFPDAPDLPFTALTVQIGSTAAGKKVLARTCADGDLVARFIPYTGGPVVTKTLPVPPDPTCEAPAPRPPAPRRPRLRVAIAAARAAVAGRRTGLPLRCAGGAPRAICRGTLSLTRKARTVRRRGGKRVVVIRTAVLARRAYTVRTGGTRTVALRLTDAGARLLAAAGRRGLRVSATATLRGGAKAKRTITLKPAARVRAS